MADKGKPPDAEPLGAGWVFARTPLDDAVDKAFDPMLAERMRILDEQILGDVVSPPLGIFDERPDGNSFRS